jgi:hypothetical protein
MLVLVGRNKGDGKRFLTVAIDLAKLLACLVVLDPSWVVTLTIS